ncbi:hypothetical protein DVH24_018396, partial [Malus domestica]
SFFVLKQPQEIKVELKLQYRNPRVVSNGSKFSSQIGLESTVGSFKEVLSPKCNIPANQQRLIYKGRILKDDQTLQSYGLEADHTLHMVRGFAPAASANTGVATNDGFPDFEQMTQNANVIRDMMNVPAIQNNMNNPDICGT